MFIRLFSVSITALLAFGMLAADAQADHRKKHRRSHAYDNYYAGPDVVKGVPGLRVFFGDYALTREEFDALYGSEEDNFDESYYIPKPASPSQRQTGSASSKVTSPSQDITTASTGKAPEPRVKPRMKPKVPDVTAKAAPADLLPDDSEDMGPAPAATPSSAAMSCDKAGAIVSGYGFQTVKPETCNGKVYAFNATRDGKSFAIKLDSASGELTEVKKLQ